MQEQVAALAGVDVGARRARQHAVARRGARQDRAAVRQRDGPRRARAATPSRAACSRCRSRPSTWPARPGSTRSGPAWPASSSPPAPPGRPPGRDAGQQPAAPAADPARARPGSTSSAPPGLTLCPPAPWTRRRAGRWAAVGGLGPVRDACPLGPVGAARPAAGPPARAGRRPRGGVRGDAAGGVGLGRAYRSGRARGDSSRSGGLRGGGAGRDGGGCDRPGGRCVRVGSGPTSAGAAVQRGLAGCARRALGARRPQRPGPAAREAGPPRAAVGSASSRPSPAGWRWLTATAGSRPASRSSSRSAGAAPRLWPASAPSAPRRRLRGLRRTPASRRPAAGPAAGPRRPPRDSPARRPLDRLAERERALVGLLTHLGAAGEEPREVAGDAAAALRELGARASAVEPGPPRCAGGVGRRPRRRGHGARRGSSRPASPRTTRWSWPRLMPSPPTRPCTRATRCRLLAARRRDRLAGRPRRRPARSHPLRRQPCAPCRES